MLSIPVYLEDQSNHRIHKFFDVMVLSRQLYNSINLLQLDIRSQNQKSLWQFHHCRNIQAHDLLTTQESFLAEGVRLIVALKYFKKGRQHGGGKNREKFRNVSDKFSLSSERLAKTKKISLVLERPAAKKRRRICTLRVISFRILVIAGPL